MKICQVGTGFTSIPPQISAAAEEVIYFLSRELVSLKCDVTIVDIKDGRRGAAEIPIIQLPCFSFIKTTRSNSPGLIARRLSFSLFSSIWLKEFKKGFEIIHFHNQFPASLFYLLSGHSSKTAPATVFTVHTPIWGLFDSEIPRDVRLKYVLELEAMKRADKIVVVSETLRRSIVRLLGLEQSSIEVIPNGVRTDLFSPSRADSVLRKSLAPNGEKIVLCVGRVSRYKGQKELVNAMPEIVRENPNVKFVFVGPVDDVEYFKAICDAVDSFSLGKYCVFTGTVSSDLVPKYFATSDVCVVLSATEAGPPLTLFQAMSSSKAIIASAIPQNLEAAKQGDEIVFVNPLDTGGVSRAINRLLVDEDARTEIGEKARRTALANFDWKETAKRTLRLYQSVDCS